MLCLKLNRFLYNGLLISRAPLGRKCVNFSLYAKVFALETRNISPSNENSVQFLACTSFRKNQIKNCSTSTREIEDSLIKEIRDSIADENNDKVMELLDQIKDLNTNQLCQIIQCAAIKRNETIIQKALSLLPEAIRNQTLIDENLQAICAEIVHLNKNRSFEDKLDPYHLIIRHLPVWRTNDEYGSFLLTEMIKANESTSIITKFCENLIESKRNIHSIQACLLRWMEISVSKSHAFLEYLAAEQKLQSAHFQPLFLYAKNYDEAIDVIKLATKLKCSFDTSALLEFVLPTMVKAKDISFDLITAGVQWKDLKTAMIVHYLNKENSEMACEIGRRSRVKIDPNFIIPALTKFIKSDLYNDQSKNIANLIKILHTKGVDDGYDLAGKVVLKVCDKFDRLNNFALTKQVLTDYNDFNVKISRQSFETIQSTLKKHMTHVSILYNLISDEIFTKNQPEQNAPISEIAELQQQLADAESSGQPFVHGLLISLLGALIKHGNYDEAMKIRRKCEEAGTAQTPGYIINLLKLWISVENEDKALETYEIFKAKRIRDKRSNTHTIIDLATLLLKKDRLDDAMRLINELGECKASTMYTRLVNHNASFLLNAAADYSVRKHYKENLAEIFFNILIEKGYCDYSNNFLNSIIKEHINKKQTQEAIDTFTRFANQYRKTPRCVPLLTHLIELEETARENDDTTAEFGLSKEKVRNNIQAIIDLMSVIHGPENSNTNLISAFACAGKSEPIRKIFSFDGIQFDKMKLLEHMKYVENDLKIKAAITITHSTQGMGKTFFNIEHLYEFVLNDFVLSNDYKAALQFYKEIQLHKYGKYISKNFYKTFVELLVKNKQPLPGDVKQRLRI